ncbi:MAG: phenylacetate--CoA ligase [Victivallales bacterium]|nr:phenylacetate--CoA ligase [Victivallales bacterium]
MSEMYFNPVEETYSREELTALQDKRLKAMVKHVYEGNAWYRERFQAAGVDPANFGGLADLEKLPVMGKLDFRSQYPEGMRCVPREQIQEMHMSSGSTGTPVVMLYTLADVDQWAECMARCYVMAGVRPSDVVQITPGLGLFNGGFGCFHGARKAGCFIVPTGPGNTARQIRLAQDFHTRAIVCVVSYCSRIIELLEQQKQTLPDLKIGIFGAETFTEAMKENIRSHLGIDVYDIYGMTETGGIGTLGQDCRFHNGTHVWEDHYICEIVNPQTYKAVPDGEVGELVVTSLTRQALPVVRFHTGDLTSVLSRERCECGRTHIRLAPITGRVDDMIIIKGVNIFPSQVEHSLLKIPGVLPEYQIFVTDCHGVKGLYVKVEAEPGVTGHTVCRQLREDLGFAPEGDVVAPGSLPRNEGKAKRVFYLADGEKVP